MPLEKFLVEGVRNLNEAVTGGWKIKALLMREVKLSDWARGIGSYDCGEKLPEHVRLSENPFLVVDRPSNKGILGTMIRSCEAFGVDALLLAGHGVDIYV